MDPTAEELIVAIGSWGSVRYALRADDSRLAEEFISGLPDKDQAHLAALFDRMAQTGEIRNQQKFRKEAGRIFGFKKHQIRIGCFVVGRTWWLTHGFRKKGDHWPKAELERAEVIRCEHMRKLGLSPG